MALFFQYRIQFKNLKTGNFIALLFIMNVLILQSINKIFTMGDSDVNENVVI